MKNKYLVIINSIAKEKELFDLLNDNKLKFWHYIDGFWIIIGNIDISELSDLLQTIYKTKIIIFEVDKIKNINYITSNNQSLDWLLEHFNID